MNDFPQMLHSHHVFSKQGACDHVQGQLHHLLMHQDALAGPPARQHLQGQVHHIGVEGFDMLLVKGRRKQAAMPEMPFIVDDLQTIHQFVHRLQAWRGGLARLVERRQALWALPYLLLRLQRLQEFRPIGQDDAGAVALKHTKSTAFGERGQAAIFLKHAAHKANRVEAELQEVAHRPDHGHWAWAGDSERKCGRDCHEKTPLMKMAWADYTGPPNGGHNPLATSAARSKSGSCHREAAWPSWTLVRTLV